MAALVLVSASCSGADDPVADEATAPTQQDVTQQEVTAPADDPAASDAAASDDAAGDDAAASDAQESEFAACTWDRSAPVPVAADVDDLAAKWDAAVAAVAPDELTAFDVATSYSIVDENRVADGVGNYVGDRVFLTGAWQTDGGVDAASLLIDPDSPAIDSAVRAFVTSVLGSDAPEDAVDQVIDSLDLWPGYGPASEAVVHSCFWHARYQPLSTADDDFVYVIGVVAAETSMTESRDVARWLRTDEHRTVATLFVRDARRWNGQSDE